MDSPEFKSIRTALVAPARAKVDALSAAISDPEVSIEDLNSLAHEAEEVVSELERLVEKEKSDRLETTAPADAFEERTGIPPNPNAAALAEDRGPKSARVSAPPETPEVTGVDLARQPDTTTLTLRVDASDVLESMEDMLDDLFAGLERVIEDLVSEATAVSAFGDHLAGKVVRGFRDNETENLTSAEEFNLFVSEAVGEAVEEAEVAAAEGHAKALAVIESDHERFLEKATAKAYESGWDDGCRALKAIRLSTEDHRVLDALADIAAELERARKKFPGKNVTFAALVEEVGELATALFSEPRADVEKEAVQVAVMAMRIILDGDHTFDAWRAAQDLDALQSEGSS